MKVLMIISFIVSLSAATFMPCFYSNSYTELKDRLCPTDISFSVLLKTNLGLSLLIA
jgi:hypothetical protein